MTSRRHAVRESVVAAAPRKSAPSFWRQADEALSDTQTGSGYLVRVIPAEYFRLWNQTGVWLWDLALAFGTAPSSLPLCRGEERGGFRTSRAQVTRRRLDRGETREGRVSFPLRGSEDGGRGRRLGRAGVCESARSALSPETDGIGDGVRYPPIERRLQETSHDVKGAGGWAHGRVQGCATRR